MAAARPAPAGPARRPTAARRSACGATGRDRRTTRRGRLRAVFACQCPRNWLWIGHVDGRQSTDQLPVMSINGLDSGLRWSPVEFMTRFLADEHVRVLWQEAERTRSCIPRTSRTPAEIGRAHV